MTTNNHLNRFAELDCETTENHSKTADELLNVENLDFDNTMYLAEILFKLERYNETIEQLKNALSLRHDDKLLTLIGITYFKMGEYETAVEYLSRNDETSLTYKMLSYEFLKDFNNAIQCGKELLKINSRNTSIINRIIDYYFNLEEYGTCLSYIHQSRYKNKYRHAEILYKSRIYEECIEIASKIRSAEAYHLCGKAYFELGKIKKASKYLYKSYEKDGNIDTLFEIADIYSVRQTGSKAIYYLKEVLIHDKDNFEAYARIASAYLYSDNIQAIEYAKKALEITRKVPSVYITLSEAHIQLGHDFEISADILDEGIMENPNSAELWAEKGNLHFANDPYTFMKSYETAINIDPKKLNSYIEYISLLMLEGEVEKAKKVYNQMLFYFPLFEKSFDEIEASYRNVII